MASQLRPLAFQVAASMVLWECYCSMGKPTQAEVDHGKVHRAVLPSGSDPGSDESKDLAVASEECARYAHGWLEREGFIRSVGYGGNLQPKEWELTLKGLGALGLSIDLDSGVPGSAADQLGKFFGRLKGEAADRAPAAVFEGAAAVMGRIWPMIWQFAQTG